MGITQRIDEVTLIPDSHQRAVLPAPKSVKIELSNSCNYRCGFCALRMREKQTNEDMDINLFKRITTEMREAGVEEVGCFFLGESFMNPALLLDAVTFLKKELEMPYVFLTSNMSIATPEWVGQIMEAGLDSLKWSVNAFSKEQFETIMDVKYKLFLRGLENAKKAWEMREEYGYKTGLYASSIHYDDNTPEHGRELLEEHIFPYVDEHYWLPLYSMGSFATQREAELGYRPTAGNQGRLDALRDPLPCWSAFTEGHVRADGGLSACCFDATANWIMGDLKKQSFMSCWNSDKFIALREAHLSKDVTGTVCEKCVAY